MALPSLSVLWIGIRPKTLSMALMPVFVASALTVHHGHALNWFVLAVIAISATAIQIATNLFNDAQDSINGTDTDARVGPQRITHAGLASTDETKRSAFLFIFIASLGGLYLIWIGGIQIALIGLASLLCAYAYSNGPAPISRGPFGELFVILFFGVIAFNASYYLLVGNWPIDGWLYGIAIGCPASAILLLNNYRDLENDTCAGRKTLAIYLGNTMARRAYITLLLSPYLLLSFFMTSFWFLLGLPLAMLAIYKIYHAKKKAELNPCLGISAASQILLSIGLMINLL